MGILGTILRGACDPVSSRGRRVTPSFRPASPVRAAGLAVALLLAIRSASAAPGVPETRALPNGLAVVTLEDHALPLVAVSLWVHAGSKDELETSAGYAHFLEHLLQRGAGTTGPFEYQRLSQRWGGSFGVRSNYDRTAITLTGVPAVLGDLIDAAATLAFGASLKDSEIDLELGTLNQEIHNYYDMPSSVIYLETMRQNFTGHPYHSPMLGNFRTLGTLKHEALDAFYRNLYVPNNMTLALGGDLDPKRAASLVDAAFGKAPRSGTLAPKPKPPTSFTGHSDVEKRADVKESWVSLSFAVPGYRSPDRAALEVIARALGDAGGAPLSQAMQRDKTGNAARVALSTLEDGGMLYIALAPATPELSYGVARSALQEVIAFKKRGLKPEQLRALVGAILRDERLRFESLAEKTSELAEAALFGGARYAWDLPETYRRLTPEIITAAAARYLVSDNLKLVILVPKEVSPFSEEAKQPFHATLDGMGAAPHDSSPGLDRVLYAGDEAARVTPGAWGNPRDAAGLRTPERVVLPNGLTVVVQEDHRSGLAALSLHVRAGSWADPPGKEGLASVAGRMIGAGGMAPAGGPPRDAAAREGERLTNLPVIQVTRDVTEVRLLITPDELKPGLARLIAAVRHPPVDEATFDAARKANLEVTQRSNEDPASAGLELFHEKVYSGHPYAHGVAGSTAGLQSLTRQDAVDYLTRHVRPSTIVLAVSGDVAAADLFKLCRELAGDWKEPAQVKEETPAAAAGSPVTAAAGLPAGATAGTTAGPAAVAPARATAGARTGEFVRSLTSGQSHVLVGVPGVPLLDDAFETVRLLGTALTLQGFEEMVFRRRAAFSVTAIPEGFRDGGALALEVVTQPPRQDEAVFDLQQLMRHMALEDLPAPEIAALARMQAGREAIALQGVQALASTLAYREATGLGALSYRRSFEPAALPTSAQLREAAVRILRPEDWIVIKVGRGSE